MNNEVKHHTLIALVENKPGVLNRVASLFRRRGFNIESVAVGPSEEPGLSRMTIVVDGTRTNVDQVAKQLYKLVDVVKISDITGPDVVGRELALARVLCNGANRSEVMQVADIFRAGIVDVSHDSVIIEITGDPEKIESFLELVRPFGLKEVARTGRVALPRGLGPDADITYDEKGIDASQLERVQGNRPPVTGKGARLGPW
ncbi:MAG: acetolactate synthase small subunit [Dehalococcoidia bacterium]|nr:acetolactate synthase small subunit [Dehalococcoidia bacterium]